MNLKLPLGKQLLAVREEPPRRRSARNQLPAAFAYRVPALRGRAAGRLRPRLTPALLSAENRWACGAMQVGLSSGARSPVRQAGFMRVVVSAARRRRHLARREVGPQKAAARGPFCSGPLSLAWSLAPTTFWRGGGSEPRGLGGLARVVVPTVAKDAPRNVGSGTLCSRWGQLLGVSRAALELTRTWLQLSRFEATNRTPLGAHPALSEPSAVSNGDAGKAEPHA